jgi:hypothetical protein
MGALIVINSSSSYFFTLLAGGQGKRHKYFSKSSLGKEFLIFCILHAGGALGRELLIRKNCDADLTFLHNSPGMSLAHFLHSLSLSSSSFNPTHHITIKCFPASQELLFSLKRLKRDSADDGVESGRLNFPWRK